MHSAETQRVRLLVQLENFLERPLFVLSIIWVVLVVVDLIYGLTPFANALSIGIWVIFGMDLILKMIIAPRKLRFLRRNWITILSLMLPAFRILRVGRVLRTARVLRGVRLATVLGTANRGIRALRRTLRRHGFAYVVAATMLVMFAGAAGMMSFEREGPNREAFDTYSESLWWTAMLITTLGSEFWPQTGGGRVLTLFIALYAFAVFGYITATLASFFIIREREEAQEVARARAARQD